MSRDAVDNHINRLSLVMTMDADIIKICKQMDFPPSMVELLLRFHNQQLELEKSINELRSTQLEIARVIERQADTTLNVHNRLLHMGDQLGYKPEEVVSTEKVVKDE